MGTDIILLFKIGRQTILSGFEKGGDTFPSFGKAVHLPYTFFEKGGHVLYLISRGTSSEGSTLSFGLDFWEPYL